METKAQHTPGPWLLETESRSPDGSDLIVTNADGHYTVATCRITTGTGVPDTEVAEANARLCAAAPKLRAVAEATLLFHCASPWGEAKDARWRELTGSDEATTKALCDFARATLAKADVQP